MNDEEIRQLLKRTIFPVADRELKHDLWPRLVRRMEDRAVRVHWSDWVLVACLAVLVLVFPGAIPGMVYHF